MTAAPKPPDLDQLTGTRPLSLPPAVELGLEYRRRGASPPPHIDALVGEYERRGIIGKGEVATPTAEALAARRLRQIEKDDQTGYSTDKRLDYVDQQTEQWFREQEQNYMQSERFRREQADRPLFNRITDAIGMTSALGGSEDMSQEQSNRLFDSLKPVLMDKRKEFGKQYDQMHSPGAELLKQREQAAAYLAQNYRQRNPDATDSDVYDHVLDELARQGYQPAGVERYDAQQGPVDDTKLLKTLNEIAQRKDRTIVGETIRDVRESVPYVGDAIAGLSGTPVRGVGEVAGFAAKYTEAALGLSSGEGSGSEVLYEGTDRLLKNLGLDKGTPEEINAARGFVFDLGTAIGDIGLIVATRNPQAASRMAAVMPGTAYFGAREAGSMSRDAYKRYIELGMDQTEAQALASGVGVASGAMTAVLERIPLDQYLQPAKRGMLNRAIRGAIAEGSTEAAQELSSSIVSVGADIEDMTLSDLLGRMLYAGAIGATAGGVANTLIRDDQRVDTLENAARGDRQSRYMLALDNAYRTVAERSRALFSKASGAVDRAVAGVRGRRGGEPATTTAEQVPDQQGRMGGRSDPKVLATPKHAGAWYAKTFNDAANADVIAAAVEANGERLRLTEVPVSALNTLVMQEGDLDATKVQSIAELDEQSKSDLPPIIAVGDQTGLDVIDGTHRVEGLKQANPAAKIKAYVPESIAQAIEDGTLAPQEAGPGVVPPEQTGQGEGVSGGAGQDGGGVGPGGREGVGPEAEGGQQAGRTTERVEAGGEQQTGPTDQQIEGERRQLTTQRDRYRAKLDADAAKPADQQMPPRVRQIMEGEIRRLDLAINQLGGGSAVPPGPEGATDAGQGEQQAGGDSVGVDPEGGAQATDQGTGREAEGGDGTQSVGPDTTDTTDETPAEGEAERYTGPERRNPENRRLREQIDEAIRLNQDSDRLIAEARGLIESDTAQRIEEAETGQPATFKLYRGTGRDDRAEAYSIVDVPILGEGRYYATTRGEAEDFGPNVEDETVSLDNPLVIDSDAAFREFFGAGEINPITYGMMQASNEGLQGEQVRERAAEIAREQAEDMARKVRESDHDGVVVRIPDSDAGKRLAEVFGITQVFVPQQQEVDTTDTTDETPAEPGTPVRAGEASQGVRVRNKRGDVFEVIKAGTARRLPKFRVVSVGTSDPDARPAAYEVGQEVEFNGNTWMYALDEAIDIDALDLPPRWRVRAKMVNNAKAERGNDAMLLFRMGDFYEMIGPDAETARSTLGLTTTTAPNTELRIAGVPAHSVEDYLRRLVSAGKRPALVEEIAEPEPQADERADAKPLTETMALDEEVGEGLSKGRQAKLRTIQKRVGGMENVSILIGRPSEQQEPDATRSQMGSIADATAKSITSTIELARAAGDGPARLYVYSRPGDNTDVYAVDLYMDPKEPTDAQQADQDVPEAEEEPETRGPDGDQPQDEAEAAQGTEVEPPDTEPATDAADAADDPGVEPETEVDPKLDDDALVAEARALANDSRVPLGYKLPIERNIKLFTGATKKRKLETRRGLIRAMEQGKRELWSQWKSREIALRSATPDIEDSEQGRAWFYEGEPEGVRKKWEQALGKQRRGKTTPKRSPVPKPKTVRAAKDLKSGLTRANRWSATEIKDSDGKAGAMLTDGGVGIIATPRVLVRLEGPGLPAQMPGRQVPEVSRPGYAEAAADIPRVEMQGETDLQGLYNQIQRVKAIYDRDGGTNRAMLVRNTDGTLGIVGYNPDTALAETNVREGYTDVMPVDLDLADRAVASMLTLGAETAMHGYNGKQMLVLRAPGMDGVQLDVAFMGMRRQRGDPEPGTAQQARERFEQDADARREARFPDAEPPTSASPVMGSPANTTPPGQTDGPPMLFDQQGKVEPDPDTPDPPDVALPAGWGTRKGTAQGERGEFRRTGADKPSKLRQSILQARARAQRDKAAVDAADNIYSIIRDLTRRLGAAPPGKGRAPQLGRSAAGFIRPWTGDIRLYKGSYVSTQVHELGHLLHKLLFAPRGAKVNISSRQLDHLPKEIKGELVTLGKDLYGERKPAGGYKSEGWAETIRFLVVNPTHLKERAPKTYQLVTMKLKTEHPETWAALLDARIRLKNAIRLAEIDPVDQFIAHDTVETNYNTRTLYDDFRTTMFDRFHRLVTLKRDVGLDKMPAKVDPHRGALRVRGHISGDIETMWEYGTFNPADPRREVTGKSLREIFEPVKDNDRLFQNYLAARRAIEKRAQGFNVFPQDARLPDQTSTPKLNDFIKRTEREYPAFKQAADEFQDFNQWLIGSYATHYGLISSETAKLIIDKNLEYVTFRYKKTDDALTKKYTGRGGGSFVNTGTGIRRFSEGRGEQIIPPLEAFFASMEGIVGRARNNEVGKSVARLYETGNEGIGRWLNKISRPMEAMRVTDEQLRGEIGQQLGINVADDGSITLPPWLEGLGENELNALVQSIESVQGATFWKPGMRTDRERGEISVLVAGKPQFYEVSDKRLFDVLEGIGSPTNVNLLVRILGFPSRVLRAGATQKNPSFGAINLVRDLIQALVMTETQLNKLDDQTRIRLTAMKQAYTGGDWYRLFLASGANMSGIYNEQLGTLKERPAAFEAAVNKMGLNWMFGPKNQFENRFAKTRLLGLIKGNTPKQIFKDMVTLGPLNRFNGAMEMAVRMGELAATDTQQQRTGVEPGEALLNAGQAAADVTLDFERGGTWAKQVNEVIPFFNAALLGADKQARFTKAHPFKSLGRILGFVIAPSIASMLMNWDNEDYWAKPMRMRDRYWFFPTGETDNGIPIYLRVPKPYGLGAFAVVFERTFASMWGINPSTGERGDDQAFDGAVQAVINEFRPALNLAGVLPIIEVNAGEQGYSFWRDNEIVSGADKDLPYHMQGASRSSDLARVLGKQLDYPPAKIDYLISNLFGGLGRDIVSTAMDPVIRAVDPEAKEGEPVEFGDYLMIRRFVSGGTRGGHMAIARFYDEYERLQRVNRGLNALEDAPEKYERYQRDHAHELALWPAYSDGQRRMSEGFRELRRLYKQRGEMDADVFEQQVDQTYDRIVESAREVRAIRDQQQAEE